MLLSSLRDGDAQDESMSSKETAVPSAHPSEHHLSPVPVGELDDRLSERAPILSADASANPSAQADGPPPHSAHHETAGAHDPAETRDDLEETGGPMITCTLGGQGVEAAAALAPCAPFDFDKTEPLEVQCSHCAKWRLVEVGLLHMLPSDIDSCDWTCNMHPDDSLTACSDVEPSWSDNKTGYRGVGQSPTGVSLPFYIGNPGALSCRWFRTARAAAVAYTETRSATLQRRAVKRSVDVAYDESAYDADEFAESEDDARMDEAQLDAALVEGRTAHDEKEAEAEEHAAIAAAAASVDSIEALPRRGGVKRPLHDKSGPEVKRCRQQNGLICWGNAWTCDVFMHGLRWTGPTGTSESEALSGRASASRTLESIVECIRKDSVSKEVLDFCRPDLVDVVKECKLRGNPALKVTVAGVHISYLKDERSALIAYAILSDASVRMRAAVEKRAKRLAAEYRKLATPNKPCVSKRQTEETMCSICLNECNETKPWGYMIHCCGKPFHVSCMTQSYASLGARCPACRTETRIAPGRLLDVQKA